MKIVRCSVGEVTSLTKGLFETSEALKFRECAKLLYIYRLLGGCYASEQALLEILLYSSAEQVKFSIMDLCLLLTSSQKLEMTNKIQADWRSSEDF